jgi:hypothetical protein
MREAHTSKGIERLGSGPDVEGASAAVTGLDGGGPGALAGLLTA